MQQPLSISGWQRAVPLAQAARSTRDTKGQEGKGTEHTSTSSYPSSRACMLRISWQRVRALEPLSMRRAPQLRSRRLRAQRARAARRTVGIVCLMSYHVKPEGSRSASCLSICGGQRTRIALYAGCSLWRTPGSRHHGSDPSAQRPFGSLSPVVTAVGSGAICRGNPAWHYKPPPGWSSLIMTNTNRNLQMRR